MEARGGALLFKSYAARLRLGPDAERQRRRRARRRSGARRAARSAAVWRRCVRAEAGYLEPQPEVVVQRRRDAAEALRRGRFSEGKREGNIIVKDVRGSESNCEQDSRKM